MTANIGCARDNLPWYINNNFLFHLKLFTQPIPIVELDNSPQGAGVWPAFQLCLPSQARNTETTETLLALGNSDPLASATTRPSLYSLLYPSGYRRVREDFTTTSKCPSPTRSVYSNQLTSNLKYQH